MSTILKDDLIKACADAYRVASETEKGIKAGELASMITSLKKGAKLIEKGEITLASTVTATIRAPKITLPQLPDLFFFYLQNETVDETYAATVGAVYLKVENLQHIFSLENINVNCAILRDANSPIYYIDSLLTTEAATVQPSGEANVRTQPTALYPLYPNTYYWEAYKLWNGVTA